MLDKVASNPSQKQCQLSQVPTRRFYSELHSYLKRDRKLGKCEIGAIYVSIDPQLNGYRADNAYRVIVKNTQEPRHSHDKAKDRNAFMQWKQGPTNSTRLKPTLFKEKCWQERQTKGQTTTWSTIHTTNRTIESLQVEVLEATAALTQTTSSLEATKLQLEADQTASSHLQSEHEELQETVARLISLFRKISLNWRKSWSKLMAWPMMRDRRMARS